VHNNRRPAARRLAAAELVRQCEWTPGGQCALGADFALRALAPAKADPVSQYVSRSLACARVTSAAACEADVTCSWNPAFADGQEGCFLSESQLMAIQQLCVQPRYARALGTLQACMAERRGCHCAAGGAGCERLANGAEGCQPLLGCWLARLQDQPFDLVQVMQASLLRATPLLTTLSPSAATPSVAMPARAPPAAPGAGTGGHGAAGGRRRRLMQPAGLNAPLNDDASGGKKRKPVAGAAGAGAKPQSAADSDAGQNKPIMSDGAAAASNAVGTGGVGTLEAATLVDAGILQAEATVATGIAPTTGGGAGGAGGAGEGEALPYAPPSFWKCLADAAAAVDAAREVAGVDYNSQKLSLDALLKRVPEQVRGV
jgi:hypothetical protein